MKSTTHAIKMASRRAEQSRRPGYRAGHSRDRDIANFCDYWRAVRARNGV